MNIAAKILIRDIVSEPSAYSPGEYNLFLTDTNYAVTLLTWQEGDAPYARQEVWDEGDMSLYLYDRGNSFRIDYPAKMHHRVVTQMAQVGVEWKSPSEVKAS